MKHFFVRCVAAVMGEWKSAADCVSFWLTDHKDDICQAGAHAKDVLNVPQFLPSQGKTSKIFVQHIFIILS